MLKKVLLILAILPLIASLFFINSFKLNAEETAVVSTNYRDTYSDTWVATDSLGRVTPVSGDVTTPVDKKVGIFYFTWHNYPPSFPIYDHTKAYNEGGVDGIWDIITQGRLGEPHYWAEPYFGYYRTDDEWIIRKHCRQLVNAGVDFVYLDASNSEMYKSQVMKILKTWDQIRKEGGTTPQFLFFCGDGEDCGKSDMTIAWDTLYEKGLYKDLWFLWLGKPLMLGNFGLMPKDISDFFTTRRSWADTNSAWYAEAKGKERWPWADLSPQKPGLDAKGNVEQMIVSCGFWANGSNGRSFTNGKQPTDGKDDFEFSLETTPLGLAFSEQWANALKVNPPIIMITGWNEWFAGRFGTDGGTNPANGQKIANTYIVTKDDKVKSNYFVDNFNPEFSRDIEPMKGGFGDNYYYQMVSLIRSYKGVRAIPLSSGNQTISLTSNFTQWDGVSPEYRDTLYDTTIRKGKSNGSNLSYTNLSGRNDLDFAKVTRDKENVYFLVKTRDPLTAAEGTNWMNLYIDSDQNFATGWCGYDFVLNRSIDGTKVSVEKFVDNSWNFEKVGDAEFVLDGNQLMIKSSLSILGLDVKKTFDFKWADNSTTIGEPMQFMDLGDTAPDDRFNFRYSEVDTADYVSPTDQKKNNRYLILSAGAVVIIGIAATFIIIKKKKMI